MKNKILTFTLERQSKDQEWGLSLVGGWMEGQWIQVSRVQCYICFRVLDWTVSDVTGHAGVIGQYLANGIISDKSK